MYVYAFGVWPEMTIGDWVRRRVVEAQSGAARCRRVGLLGGASYGEPFRWAMASSARPAP